MPALALTLHQPFGRPLGLESRIFDVSPTATHGSAWARIVHRDPGFVVSCGLELAELGVLAVTPFPNPSKVSREPVCGWLFF
jgi:hypothetical protein